MIGLGLVGQLTVQILNASGIKAIGIDIDASKVKLALESGSAFAFKRDQEGLEELVLEATAGYGTDAVIITATSSSNDPGTGWYTLRQRKSGIVGAVPTGFTRLTITERE